MKSYVIYTDSACDISPAILDEWGVKSSALTFRFSDSDKEYSNYEMDACEFYDRMKKGAVAKTSAVNPQSFKNAWRPLLEAGEDILYLGFSSGLSTTCASARIAADELAAEYPDRRIIVIDTLAASAGEGLLVYLVNEKKKAGADIEEAAEYARYLVPRMGIWFTVDDLVYLKRGGRISPAAAFVGNMLGIKPVLYMDDAGHLISRAKVRGRRSAIMALAEKYGELSDKNGPGVAFISHGSCDADADLLRRTLEEKYGAKVLIITDVGPVIGAHSGPGTLALFYVSERR